MKISIQFTAALLLLATLNACGPSCKEVHQEVLTPIDNVLAYLEKNPSGEELAKSGCGYLLPQLELIPDSGEKVREIADSRYSVTNRRCVNSYPSMNYGGHYGSGHHRGGRHGGGHHGGFGDPFSYNYCGLWKYDTVRDPNYGKVIELSQQIDLMYSQANHMCGEAQRGNLEGARSEAVDLAAMIRDRIKPETAMIHRRLCGNEQENPHRDYGTPHH